jgi:hypothetical protein
VNLPPKGPDKNDLLYKSVGEFKVFYHRDVEKTKRKSELQSKTVSDWD